MEVYKDYTKELFSFLVKDTTLSLGNPLRFWKNFNKTTVSGKIEAIKQNQVK